MELNISAIQTARYINHPVNVTHMTSHGEASGQDFAHIFLNAMSLELVARNGKRSEITLRLETDAARVAQDADRIIRTYRFASGVPKDVVTKLAADYSALLTCTKQSFGNVDPIIAALFLEVAFGAPETLAVQ